jgi:hypothetical protein
MCRTNAMQAFSSCRAGDNFNLSFESLTSREALQLLRSVQNNELELWKAISSRKRLGAAPSEDHANEDEPPFPDEVDDDGCVPVDVVLHHAAGNTIQNGFTLTDGGGLMALNESECYTQEVLEDTEESEEYGRGKRRRISNKQYDEFWKH